ncbi:MAG: hypothetical protein IPJ65_27805 [Archangiaceae bacterium]|nr:hypothetical protein [Archangiaceae bacterium]
MLLSLAMDPFEGLPNVAQQVPVAGKLESLSTPVEARAYLVKMKPGEVYDWVFKSFVKHHLYIPKVEHRAQLYSAPQLTGYDHPSRQSYTAIFKDNGDGTTTLIAGHADLSTGAWVHAADAARVMPAMPGATQVAQSSGEGNLTLTYLVKASPQEVEAFYADVFTQNGFTRDAQLRGWVKDGQLIELKHAGRGRDQRSVALIARPLPAALPGDEGPPR